MAISPKRLLPRIGRILLIALASLLVLIGIALVIIRINSPGREEPFLDEQGNVIPGSIAEILDTTINGARQRLTIRGRDIRNPVLLRIHGGPGNPFMPVAFRLAGCDLEDIFTVCYWDQRGAGPAYTPDLPDTAITLRNIVADGLHVSQYLRQRFQQEKIFIEGLSWGTSVGMLMAQARPEYYHAYAGNGQMGDQLLSEQLSYDFVLAEATRRNDTTAIQRLRKIGRPPYDTEDAMYAAMCVEREYVYRYVAPPPRPEQGPSLLDFLLEPSMTFSQKIGPVLGTASDEDYPAAKLLWPTCAQMNLPRDVPAVGIPVHFLQGEHDHQTETSVARMYFDTLQAPAKTWHFFEDCGHTVSVYDAPRYRQIMSALSKAPNNSRTPHE
jgi:pimeloyl-ACP methyl ester carboxylesterase